MGLNKRIEHHVKAIQDAVHILTFYQWMEELITESEEHRTNAKGQKLHERTIAKYRPLLSAT